MAKDVLWTWVTGGINAYKEHYLFAQVSWQAFVLVTPIVELFPKHIVFRTTPCHVAIAAALAE